MALASTDCKSLIAAVTVETGTPSAGFVVQLDGGISFAMKPGSANYEAILGMSGRSMLVGETLYRSLRCGLEFNAMRRQDAQISLR